jgi:hypothetical protein
MVAEEFFKFPLFCTYLLKEKKNFFPGKYDICSCMIWIRSRDSDLRLAEPKSTNIFTAAALTIGCYGVYSRSACISTRKITLAGFGSGCYFGSWFDTGSGSHLFDVIKCRVKTELGWKLDSFLNKMHTFRGSQTNDFRTGYEGRIQTCRSSTLCWCVASWFKKGLSCKKWTNWSWFGNRWFPLMH